MPLAEHTDPGYRPVRPGQPRPVYFSLRDWGILTAILSVVVSGALGVMSLLYFNRARGERLESEVKHHVTDDARREQAQDRLIMESEVDREKLLDAIHRVELRQVGRRQPVPQEP